MKRKHQALYQQLVAHHADDVYRYFCRWGLSKAEIEDCVQEAFLEAWKSIKTYREEASLKVWLLTICRRVAWRWVKASRREQEILREPGQLLLEPLEDGMKVLEQRSRLQMIDVHIKKLSEAHQEVLYLHYMQELTEPEIAQFLEIPQGTVHGRLRIARKQLRLHCQTAQRKDAV